ncbi:MULTISPECIES: sialate O-acetylesterase [unclassified Saccharicrinis]|uniref:sialate O-acetylesterase n=1 Tax=unclassified Saccharicrinis TaxID=2646859 RepID=UPI003D344B7B
MFKSPIKIQLVISLLIIGSSMAFGQNLKLANIFGDHMILQREKEVPVWGHSAPKDKITVTFAGQKKTTRATADGKWMVKLDPLKGSAKGQDMIVSGESKVVIKDILVGEVWICSGQSNMFMSASSIPEIRGLVPLVKNIRSFNVQNLVALEEQDEVQGQWKVTHPQSAVAFSFAYFLNNLANVPVGIIQTAWGSSSIEAWMPRSMTRELPHFDTIMKEFDADTLRVAKINELVRRSDAWTNQENIFLRRHSNIIYNAMMHPLIPFACRGLVWYQGERNTRYLSGLPEVSEKDWFHRVCGMKDYDEVLKKWILNYRRQWQDDKMHFMVIMLPGYGKGPQTKQAIDPESPTEPSWAWMRESQLASLDLPNTSVVNTIDLGDLKNIHPQDKLPIGQRAALLATKNTLHQEVSAMGPTFKSVDLQGEKIIVHFNNASGLKTTNSKAPSGFWIADESGEWVKANAEIVGETVTLSSPKIKEPKYIRYAFAGKPTVNLVNKSELPAYPFRTDNWDN